MPDMNLSDALFADGEWTVTVTHRAKSSATNESGYAVDSDGQTQELDVIVRPARARLYELVQSGRATSARWIMLVKDGAGVEQGDEIQYNGTWYVAGPEEPTSPVDNYTVYTLELE